MGWPIWRGRARWTCSTRLAALTDTPYRARPPRRGLLFDRIWRTLKLIAQWLMSALALLWRYGQRIAYWLSYALERARREMLQASRPLVRRIASDRRAQGIAALLGVAALLVHANLASAQFFIQPGMGIPRVVVCRAGALHRLSGGKRAERATSPDSR